MVSPRWLSLFSAALLICGAAGARAADVDQTAGYAVTLGGINIASATIRLTDSDGHYDVAANATVAGLGSLVASGTAEVEASGTVTGSRLNSEKFHLLTHARGEDFSIDVQYAHGEVTAFQVRPPIVDNVNRIPIERSQLSGVGDMLSAFVLKGPALDRSLCERHLRIFTGVERFDLAMSYLADDTATSLRTAYQGPVVQCRIKYIPVSGHFTTSETTNYLARSDRIFIWYAPLEATGYFIPYRVLMATSVGDLSMVLTSLK